MLVLQASLGQIDGKHTGHSNQASDPPIEQFGGQTGQEEKKIYASTTNGPPRKTERRFTVLLHSKWFRVALLPDLLVCHLSEAPAVQGVNLSS